MRLPTNQELDAYDMGVVQAMFKLDSYRDRSYGTLEPLIAPSGIEHYRLLRWFAEQMGDGEISELGTYQGLSAASFAMNPVVSIVCYDVNFAPLRLKEIPRNVTLLQVLDSEGFPPPIRHSDIVFVDTNHFGRMEYNVYEYLKTAAWKGLLIYDDILLNDAMKEFWNKVDHPGKLDVTHLGHATGTGLILFE